MVRLVPENKYTIKELISTDEYKKDRVRERSRTILKLMSTYIRFFRIINKNELLPDTISLELPISKDTPEYKAYKATMTEERAKEFDEASNTNNKGLGSKWNIELNYFESYIFIILFLSFPPRSQLYAEYTKKLKFLQESNSSYAYFPHNGKRLAWLKSIESDFFDTNGKYHLLRTNTGKAHIFKNILHITFIIIAFPEFLIYQERFTKQVDNYKRSIENLQKTANTIFNNIDVNLKSKKTSIDYISKKIFELDTFTLEELDVFLFNLNNDIYQNEVNKQIKELKNKMEEWEILKYWL